MAKMRAIDAAVRVLEKEGVTCAFGVPGAAINPLYSALNKRGSINHILARHVEGASHMAEGLYPRQGRQYRGLHRHLGPGRHRHDHRALFGDRGFDPDPVHHRPGAARAALQGRFSGRRHRVDRQAGDEMGGDRARAGAGAARVQPGVSHHALGTSRSGADRSADRCANGGNRIRRRNL